MIIYFLEIFISLTFLIFGYCIKKYTLIGLIDDTNQYSRNIKVTFEIIWATAMIIPIIIAYHTEIGKQVWCYLCQINYFY